MALFEKNVPYLKVNLFVYAIDKGESAPNQQKNLNRHLMADSRDSTRPIPCS